MLTKPIERELPTAMDHRGTHLMCRATREGIYMKVKGQRWSNAVLMPWGAIYTQGCLRKAAADREAKKKARAERRNR